MSRVTTSSARAGELGFGTPLAANAYLGAWGIVDCLKPAPTSSSPAG